MSTVVISHGYGADYNSVWFPYARKALEAKGHRVHIPNLPDSNAPELGPWRAALRKLTTDTNPADTVLVGHSVGGINVLRLLQGHDVGASGPFAGAVLVATPARIPAGYESLAGFFAEPFDWPRLRRAAREYRILTAADDPVLQPDPAQHVKELVVGLQATATLTATGAHYGATPDDHIDLPEAIRLVLDCLPAAR
ncbi:alpha/beta fold hydrolase [Dactylosporangium sp. McL0621]|uniref:alpha/beta fold hydrolase n=1 Tax=Dactylosporangium sp. McL0621 TaxID=3415678 RepID=UPI003CE9D2F9